MRLPNLKEHCGCDDRKFIMFEAGRLGMTEGVIVAAACALLIVAWKVKK